MRYFLGLFVEQVVVLCGPLVLLHHLDMWPVALGAPRNTVLWFLLLCVFSAATGAYRRHRLKRLEDKGKTQENAK